MPMQSQTKERIYLLVMVFCLLICAVLLISVFCDLPIAAIAPVTQEHIPVMRTGPVRGSAPTPTAGDAADGAGGEAQAPAASQEGYQITQDQLTQQMTAYIPQSFPATQVDVEILGSGGFEVELGVSKDDLKAYLESCGVSMGLKQSLALGLLPDTLEVESVLLCTRAGQDGVQLELETLSINDKSVDLDFLPDNIFQVISSAINAVMVQGGYDFDNIVFAEGVLYLK